MQPRALPGLAALIATFGLGACSGEQQEPQPRWPVDDNWTAEPGVGDGKPGRASASLAAPQPLDETNPGARALVGVRLDLSLSAQAPQARCPCLAVEVGSPTDAKFLWQAGAPSVAKGALAIAVSARGVECPGGEPDERRRRPSISAVDVEGNDVIVEIEELGEGPPLASGALIPDPAPGGSVYVRGKSRDVPYARTPSGAPCRVR